MNGPIPIGTFERQKRQNRGPAQPTHIVTEDSAALAFAKQYSALLRYCHSSARWHEWTGTHWRPDLTAKSFHWARELIRQMTQGESYKLRYLASRVSFASGVEKYAQRDPVFAVTADQWDVHPFLLATPGGTIDLKTGVLRAAKPEEHLTRLTAVAPTETSNCPLWLKFLDETTGGDLGLITFLQLWCGYCLTGDIREHALCFIYGPGGNGKSVFLNVISRILGDYCCHAAMDTFTSSRNDRHPTDLAMLKGARMVTTSETEEGRAWAESRLKSVTGGDPITAHFMRQDNFTFLPEFKLVVAGNHQPVLHNVDDAAKRRFNIVPFMRKPEQPDLELEIKLMLEAPAILRWMIEGCLNWQAKGLSRPDSVKAATSEYFEEQDMFGQWLDHHCDAEVGNHHKTGTSGELFGSWKNFAIAGGEEPGGQKRFGAELKRRGFLRHKGTNGVREWLGIRLKLKQGYGE